MLGYPFAIVCNETSTRSLDGRVVEPHDNKKNKKNTESEWRAAVIQDVVKLGLKNLPTLDPFSDVDPMLEDPRSDGQNLDALCGMSQEKIFKRNI